MTYLRELFVRDSSATKIIDYKTSKPVQTKSNKCLTVYLKQQQNSRLRVITFLILSRSYHILHILWWSDKRSRSGIIRKSMDIWGLFDAYETWYSIWMDYHDKQTIKLGQKRVYVDKKYLYTYTMYKTIVSNLTLEAIRLCNDTVLTSIIVTHNAETIDLAHGFNASQYFVMSYQISTVKHFVGTTYSMHFTYIAIFVHCFRPSEKIEPLMKTVYFLSMTANLRSLSKKIHWPTRSWSYSLFFISYR